MRRAIEYAREYLPAMKSRWTGHATAVILGSIESGSRRCAFCKRGLIHSAFRRIHADADVSIFRVADSGVTGDASERRKKKERQREKKCRSCEMTRIRKVVEVGTSDEETDFRIILKRRQRRLIDISIGPL